MVVYGDLEGIHDFDFQKLTENSMANSKTHIK